MIENKRDMLKRKRFHPDETYDSMVVTYSSDDAVKVDPVHGNGKFECALNNANSITHARKLLPLRAHVPNSYHNVTEGQNTFQFSSEAVFHVDTSNNEFEFEYRLEVVDAHNGHLVGDEFWYPAFGWDQPSTTIHRWINTGGVLAPIKIVIAPGLYTREELNEAFDVAFAQEAKNDADRGPGGFVTVDYNRWLTRYNYIEVASPLPWQEPIVNITGKWGWETMIPAFTDENGVVKTERTFQILDDAKDPDDVQYRLHNMWSLGWSDLDVIGVDATSTWPGVEPSRNLLPSVQFDGVPANEYLATKYKRTGFRLKLTPAQQTLFGTGAATEIDWAGGGSDFTQFDPDQFVGIDSAVNVAAANDLLYSNLLVIPPGYYTATQLADTLDALMKASVEPAEWQWLHRIRTYYNGGGQDADTDLRRISYDAATKRFTFYFTPELTGVVAPSDLVTTYPFTGRYADTKSVLRINADDSLLRLLGFGSDHTLDLPTDANMTIQQSVEGDCVNMDIPYVYITSPQISRNNVLTSDSRNRNILATIPMTGVPRCEYAHYQGVDIYVDNIEYRGPTSLDRVEFEVTDDKHNVLTIPTHTPVSISLKVYHDDTEP